MYYFRREMILMKKILRLQSALLKEIDKYEKLIPERVILSTGREFI